MQEKIKIKWYTRWYNWLAIIVSGLFGIFLLSKYSKNTVHKEVKEPDAEDFLESHSKAVEATEEIKKGPTRVEPTPIDNKTIHDLRKEYEEL